MKNIDKKELNEMLATNKQHQYIDVRTPNEFASEAVEGFINIPVDTLHLKLNQIDKQKPVVLICHSGGRSRMAADFLIDQGFRQVYNVAGGMIAISR